LASSGSPVGQRVKEHQAKHWDTVAAGWDRWLEWTERNFAASTEWLAGAANWKPGIRALDIACGPGYPALIGAARVQPGTFVATDLSPAMVAAVSRRARAAGLQNMACLAMDAEDLRFDDESFDAVTNAYGLMFCPDPQRAIDEAHRVLTRGGRFAAATWDEPAKNPFFSAITSVAAPILSLTLPEPGAPGLFRLASAAHLGSMLHASGFSDVQVDSVVAVFECVSVEEYVDLFADVAWKARMAALPDRERRQFRDAVRKATEPFTDGGRLRLMATSLCASGRRS
jgi:ubiquinone/menaquinone biosynthesis C-methylase UbiE